LQDTKLKWLVEKWDMRERKNKIRERIHQRKVRKKNMSLSGFWNLWGSFEIWKCGIRHNVRDERHMHSDIEKWEVFKIKVTIDKY